MINEYSKIFHKVSTYVLLGLLAFSIVSVPLLTVLFDSISNKMVDSIFMDSEDSYSSTLKWAKEDKDTVTIELIEKAQELNIPEKEFFAEDNWIHAAFDDIYYNFSYTKNTQNTSAPIYNIADKLFDAIKTNNPKAYYTLMLENVDSLYTEDFEKDMYSYVYKYRVDNSIWVGKDCWQNDCIERYLTNYIYYYPYKDIIDKNDASDNPILESKDFITTLNMVLVSKYRLDNNIENAIYVTDGEGSVLSSDSYVYDSKLYDSLKDSKVVLSFVLIIIIVVAGNIFSKEFSQGTIKFLLINPVTRRKIFWSKYLTVVSYALILTIASFLLSYMICAPLFGISQIGTSLLIVEGGSVVNKSAFLFIISKYAYGYIQLFIAMTIAFTISSLFRSSALAITISLIFYYVGATVCSVAQLFNVDVFRYTIFAVSDFEAIANGTSGFVGMTPSIGFLVLLINTVLFLLIGYDSFTRKNI